ncbi:MAG: hypothetical protein E6H05_05325 [Bacillati bacterium ANGP1]|uniref:Uncharacterized protein n=1 Tax=Candidatus Segetimicrobium genomatis TaxID=2569760 RepID=A0A537IYV8_9BACT|nr:MAG: hypothetical protein E6H05_05325 [Terrabacteria group bacterium ANGP1]
MSHQDAAVSTARAWVLLALAAVLVGGCRGRVQSTSAPVAETRVGVVDLQVVTRAHPRWQQLDAVVKQLQDVQAQLALLPPAPAMPEADVRRALDEEARRLQGELDKELAFLKQDGDRRLQAFADELRSEQVAKIQQVRRELEAQGDQEIMARRDELRAQLRAAEQQIRDEYRYPLLNLRLRAEVAGLTSEEEAKQLQQQVQALQDEREQRLAAQADETQKTFTEFQKIKEDEVNAKLKAAQDAMQVEAQRRLLTRQQQVQAELRQAAAALDETFRARLERRRKELLAAAERQPSGRQGTYVESLGERNRRLRGELVSLQEQRARLEDSILAEVKIEVAAIAQDRKLDVVLTRLVANVAGIDITTDVIQKLKR